MFHRFVEEGFGIRLRPVTEADAEFILALRTSPDLSKYIGDVSGDLEAQRRWTNRYFSQPNDYYFLIEDLAARPLGTVGVYDIAYKNGILDAEWGRWILTPGTMVAPASALLLLRFCFEHLRVDRLTSRTLVANGPVLSFHDRIGAERVSVLSDAIRAGGTLHDAVLHEMVLARWPEIKHRLTTAAQGAERFMQRAAESRSGPSSQLQS